MIWLTRDSELGELADVIQVWGECPNRFRDAHGHFWALGEGEHALTWHAINTAKLLYRTVPDTDLECIRFEGNVRRVRVPRP